MSLLSNLFGIGNPTGGPLSNVQNGMNMLQRFQQFAANPVAGLMNMKPGLNVPPNIQNNPKAVVEHLISTGQMTQDQYNQITQMAKQLKDMLPR